MSHNHTYAYFKFLFGRANYEVLPIWAGILYDPGPGPVTEDFDFLAKPR